jgi:hypothetical protein
MPNMPEGYYNRFDATKNYDAHLFRAGYVLQSAELNEVQTSLATRLQRMGDVLFKDGAIVRDARLIVDSATGAATGESGAIYLKGAVRGVPTRAFTVPITGTVTVGVYLVEAVITELEDPALRDPAIGVRNYQEPGASRLQAVPQWGYVGQTGAPAAEFYPVYEVREGIVVSKDPPPALDAVLTSLARYDRESSGGYYVVSGLRVAAEADQNTGEQVYSIQEGQARVNGISVTLATSLRIVYPATADLDLIDSEPHLSSTASAQRVDLNHSPVSTITQVRVTAEKTATLTHGAYTGVLDALPDQAVLSLVTVSQGGTTYVQGTDYKLTADQCDWSLGGAEPAPGSAYSVTYQHVATVTPTLTDTTGCTVTGAVSGTLIQITYQWKMPRYDRLCLNDAGIPTWLKGVSHEYRPAMPAVSTGLLLLATIAQTWNANRVVQNDGVRMVPMNALETMAYRIDDLYTLTAQQRLLTNAAITEPTSKLGVFVDPFLDNDMRDQGLAQTAAIVGGALTLPITASINSNTLTDIQTLPINVTVTSAIEQTARTGTMKVNPYQAFVPIPAKVTLSPTQDLWTDFNTTWASNITQRFWENMNGYWGTWDTNDLAHSTVTSSRTTTTILSGSTVSLEMLRQITVNFTMDGFGPNEVLSRVIFDNIEVAAA